MNRLLPLALVLSLLAARSEAEPDAARIEAAIADLPELTLRQIGRSPERFLQSVLTRLRRINKEGPVSFADLERADRQHLARLRAASLARVLARDLNGDGAVTRAEYLIRRDGTWGDPERADAFMLADTDGDGAVSAEEGYAHADRQVRDGRVKQRSRSDAEGLAGYDVDGDQMVTEAEVRAVVDAAAAKLAKANPAVAALARGETATCDLPRPPPGADIVLLSGYEGSALSTVAVNGLDAVTEVGTVTIDEGTRPLYIIATVFSPMIWKLDGAVERVVTFVVQPPLAHLGPGTGVVGLPPQAVRFTPPRACIKYFTKSSDGKARVARKTIAKQLQVAPSFVTPIGHYSIDGVTVPSGRATDRRDGTFLGIRFTEPKAEIENESGRATLAPPMGGKAPGLRPALPNSRAVPKADAGKADSGKVDSGKADAEPADDGPDPAEIEEVTKVLLRYNPAGVIEIDPASVIAPGKVAAYDVLPAQAGILQLLRSGSIRRTSKRTYTVFRPIPRLPAGWTPHTQPHRRFTFAPGVRRP